MQEMLVGGVERSGGHYAYMNCALGGEEVGEIYGEGNLKRLRDPKGIYDPGDRSRYHAPIGVAKAQQEKHEL
jgi:hypothetical protein